MHKRLDKMDYLFGVEMETAISITTTTITTFERG